jgi:hypothetical protein
MAEDAIQVEINALNEAKNYHKRSSRIEELLDDEILEKNTDDAFERVIDAFRTVLEVRPTTEAGLLAKLACVHKFRAEYPDAILDDMDLFSGLVVAA